MEKHPIESLMGVSMDNIKDMVDVNTVIGDPVQTQDGSTIIPISRVAFGFVAGGGEYAVSGAQTGAYGMPFAGGAGAGVSIHPMGFLVCGRNGVRLLSAGRPDAVFHATKKTGPRSHAFERAHRMR